MPSLHSLLLHGNPFALLRNYRERILTGIPQISVLDDMERVGKDEGSEHEQMDDNVRDKSDFEGKESDDMEHNLKKVIVVEEKQDRGHLEVETDLIVLKVILDGLRGIPDPRKLGVPGDADGSIGGDNDALTPGQDQVEMEGEKKEPLPTYFARISLHLRHGLSR